MAVLEVRDITVEYDSSGYVVRPLDHLGFDAEDGELVVLLGPSGCGKTTLLSALAGLLTPTAGSVRLRGSEVIGLQGAELSRYRRETVGVVFQAFNLIDSLNARANVMVPLRLSKVPHRRAAARADELLASVGLAERIHHRPSQMSGGQQQRVAIARALVHDPALVLADEPTAHLDHIQVEGVLRLLRELASPGRVVIVSTHDDRITHIADRIIELSPESTSSAQRPPEPVTLEPGAVLFSQGDRGDLVYVVDDGTIEIFRVLSAGGEEVLAHIGAGNYFGEIGPLLNLPRSASARAVDRCRLTAYPVRAFRDKFPQTIRQAIAEEGSLAVSAPSTSTQVQGPPPPPLTRS
jgi:putative ABC transport system ATP-binding protein